MSNTETLTDHQRSYLTFTLNSELFALDVRQVIEILEVTKITSVPKAPGYMKGVINLRGKVLPLIDTRVKFELSPIEFTENTCIVVMEVVIDDENLQVGALVDSVQEVIEAKDSMLQPSPSIDASYPLEFIKGVLNVNEVFIMVLEITQVFSPEEFQAVKKSKNEGMAINPDTE